GADAAEADPGIGTPAGAAAHVADAAVAAADTLTAQDAGRIARADRAAELNGLGRCHDASSIAVAAPATVLRADETWNEGEGESRDKCRFADHPDHPSCNVGLYEDQRRAADDYSEGNMG
ncbi:hypothetical protein ACFPYM_19245, partial [Methylobacterium hispanicum]